MDMGLVALFDGDLVAAEAHLVRLSETRPASDIVKPGTACIATRLALN